MQLSTSPDSATVLAIGRIEYGYTKNLGNYESERLFVSVDVPNDAPPADVLASARQWVADHLGVSTAEMDNLQHSISSERARLNSIKADIKVAQLQYDSLKTGLQKLGVTLPVNPEDLPF